MDKSFQIVTSTASLCIFDPNQLKHRLADPPDWWADYFQEIDEVNAGNVLIVGLGADGLYQIALVDQLPGNAASVSARLSCKGEQLFIGPGEDITGGHLEPSNRRTTGEFISVKAGIYEISVAKTSDTTLAILICPADGDAENHLEEQLLLD